MLEQRRKILAVPPAGLGFLQVALVQVALVVLVVQAQTERLR